MKTIKIKFVDFWPGFIAEQSFLYKLLSQKFTIALSDDPDILFFSYSGTENIRKKYNNCLKIFYTGENIVPDFNTCDFAIGFDEINFNDRYMRLPLFYTYPSFNELRKQRIPKTSEELLNRPFCSFVVSNSNCAPERTKFYKLLNEYKEVKCGGRLYNNIGGPVKDKLSFISNYKFNIAFENSSVLGYTTEKLMEPLVANTLPIYWGNPEVYKDFNKKAFINVNEFSTLEDAVEFIVKLDQNEEKYLSYFFYNEPLINDFGKHWEEHVTSFLTNAINKQKKYLTDYGTQAVYRKRLRQAYYYFDIILRIKLFLTKLKK